MHTRLVQPDPRLDRFRVPASDACWWCGDAASTREHKFKRTDLKRMATAGNGSVDAKKLFKGSDAYTGILKTMNKGSAVQWGKSLCAACNGARSQPFDLAYEQLSDYIWNHQVPLLDQSALSLPKVFGPNWRQRAVDAGRYLAKQLRCALIDQCLPVPNGLVDFLDGAPTCPAVSIFIYRDRTFGDLCRLGQRHGVDPRGYWLRPMPAFMSSDGTRLTGAVYTYIVGHVGLRVAWFEDSTERSFFEYTWPRLPLLGDPLPPQLAADVERRG